MGIHRFISLLVAVAAVTAACTSDGTTASTSSASVEVTVSSPAAPASGPGTNGKIAFYRDDQGVLTIDPDGTNEHLLDKDYVLGVGAWSPDSSKLLVFVFLDPQGARPATVNADGSDFSLLDSYPDLRQHLGCGFWSPDSSRLLCGTQEDENPVNGIYTLRSSDGKGLKQITSTPGCTHDRCIEDAPGGYSSEGSSILFKRQERSTHLGPLFVVNSDGSGLVQVSPPGMLIPEADPLSADWSPQGSQVAFGAFRKSTPEQGGALFVVNADGTDLHRITPFGVGAFSVNWSPDGGLIAFNSDLTDDPQIYVVHPDGTGLLQLTQPSDGDSSFTPVWSPDSQKLLFQRGSSGTYPADLWIMNANGTQPFQLTDTPENENTPNWGSAPVG